MDTIFRGENILEFVKTFPDNDSCKKVLAQEKWKDEFTCKHCGNKQYTSISGSFSRECTTCRYIESPTAGTLFHNVKFDLQKAFCIVFEMTCTSKGLSSTQAAKRYGLTQKTTWFFMQKVKIAMKSSFQYPLMGDVQVDEFVVGGVETGKRGRSYDTKKSKVVCSIELTEDGKIKRGYAKVIDDYSAESIKPLFDDHISKTAAILTDKWTAYKKIAKEYHITQKKSNVIDFKPIHTIIHLIKTGIRTIQSHVNKGHLQKYLDEFFFRLNRSIYKETIFNNLIIKMMNNEPATWKQIILPKPQKIL